MNRPEKRNAVNRRLHEELGWVWRDIDTDPEVSVAVITGAGSSFSSGGEAGTFDSDGLRSSQELDNTIADIAALVNEMIQCRKPIVSAINGLAMASGLAVALAADISIAGEGVKLIDGHLSGGMVAGDHATLLWPLYMSLAKARYYLLSGEAITGSEADALGLVSMSVPDDEVLPRALAVAERVATNPQFAVRWTKRALNAWVKQQAPLFELSTALQMLSVDRPDMVEAMAAFAQRRPPKFPSVQP
jgi:enoyl-CoA hydratase